MNTKEITEYFRVLVWDLNSLMDVEGESSLIVLFYSREILDRLPLDSVCRKAVPCQWILQLHSGHLPQFGTAFRDLSGSSADF
jgi:hypothetical protein